LDALESLHRQYRDQVVFFVVYIKEAHPEDGWVLGRNRRAEIRVADPTTDERRAELAQTCALRMRIRMPVLVDGIDNAVASAYGVKPPELDAAIRTELG